MRKENCLSSLLQLSQLRRNKVFETSHLSIISKYLATSCRSSNILSYSWANLAKEVEYFYFSSVKLWCPSKSGYERTGNMSLTRMKQQAKNMLNRSWTSLKIKIYFLVCAKEKTAWKRHWNLFRHSAHS